MSEQERRAFLAEQRVVVCATNGPRGWPHLMPLWYVVREGEIWAWTYAKSQKVRNLERDPRATLQVEEGEQYHELRGVMIEAETVIHRETELVAGLGAELLARYGGGTRTWSRGDRRAGGQAGGAAVRRASGWRAGITASSPASTERR